MSTISKDISTVEIEKWLNFLKVREKKRTAYKDAIETLTDAVSEGVLVVNEDCTLKLKLDYPIGVDSTIKELTFKDRLEINTLQPHMLGVKSGDGDGRILATIAGLTGQPKSVLGKIRLGSEDYNIASSIAIFFM